MFEKFPKRKAEYTEQGLKETKGISGQESKKRDMLSLVVWLWEQLRK